MEGETSLHLPLYSLLLVLSLSEIRLKQITQNKFKINLLNVNYYSKSGVLEKLIIKN